MEQVLFPEPQRGVAQDMVAFSYLVLKKASAECPLGAEYVLFPKDISVTWSLTPQPRLGALPSLPPWTSALPRKAAMLGERRLGSRPGVLECKSPS